MTQTYGDITVGTVWDGDVVTKIERRGKFSDEVLKITVFTRTGGKRTEASNFPLATLTGVRIAEPLLADVPDDQLALGAGVFADQVRDGFEDLLDGLHGCANEIHRRRALDCIERGCSRADDGCVCHHKDDEPAERDVCPGHYDDDHAILHGEYFCDGTCQPA